MKKAGIALLVGFAAFTAIGCAMHPLSDEERWQIREIRELGLEEKEVVSPTLAGVLNVIPGAGSAYLAINGEPWQAVPAVVGVWDLAGTLNWAAHEGPQAGQFISLSMFWVWGIPSAIAEANAMNDRATIRYYAVGPGKEELERKRRSKPPPR